MNLLFIFLITITINFNFIFQESLYAKSMVKILAMVENNAITNIDLNNFKKVLDARAKTLNIKSDTAPLDLLIEEGIVRKYTKEKKWYPSEKEIDTFIEQRIKNLNLTKAMFINHIKQNGYTEETFRNDLKYQKAKANIIERELKNRVTISTEELKQEFYNNTKEPTETKSYVLKMKSFKGTCNTSDIDFSELPEISFLDTELQTWIKNAIKDTNSGEITKAYYNGECTLIKTIKQISVENPLYTENKKQITQKLVMKKIDIEFNNWLNKQKKEFFVKKF